VLFNRFKIIKIKKIFSIIDMNDIRQTVQTEYVLVETDNVAHVRVINSGRSKSLAVFF